MAFIALFVGAVNVAGSTAGPPADADPARAPRDASYTVEGHGVQLRDGEAARPAAPGSAIQVRTRLVGEPVQGDLDGDGDEDAALWLVQSPGGSGTFYYLAAAINEAGYFRGSVATFVGDRIEPRSLQISNGVVLARYRDRPAGQAMATPPTRMREMYLTWEEETASPGVFSPDAGVAFLQGLVVIGHEVRTFRPCGESNALWLAGQAPALKDLMAVYGKTLPGAAPYTPLFVSLLGRRVQGPVDGFGAEYEAALEVSRVIRAWPGGHCRTSTP